MKIHIGIHAHELPAALRVIVSPGGIVRNVLLGEQVYVPLLVLENLSINSIPSAMLSS